MHTSKKEKRKILSSLRYSSARNNTSTIKTTLELNILQKRDLSKRNNAQASPSPDQKILGFLPKGTSCSQNNAFNTDIASHNQLRPDFGFSP
jgi:hypothetical protein